MAKKQQQISITLPPDLREAVRQAAEREGRDLAQQIRYLVAQAMARRGWRRAPAAERRE